MDTVQLRPELTGTPQPPSLSTLGSDTSTLQQEWALANGQCPERVSDGLQFPLYHLCRKKLKDRGLCGVHLAVVLRAEAKAAARVEAKRADRARQTSAMALAGRLGKHGIKASPQFSSNTYSYTGALILSADAAKDLLRLLETM